MFVNYLIVNKDEMKDNKNISDGMIVRRQLP